MSPMILHGRELRGLEVSSEPKRFLTTFLRPTFLCLFKPLRGKEALSTSLILITLIIICTPAFTLFCLLSAVIQDISSTAIAADRVIGAIRNTWINDIK